MPLTRPRKVFWTGFGTGVGAVALLIAVWIGWGIWTLNNRMDERYAEYERERLASIQLPSPELEAFDPPERASYDWTVRALDGEPVPMDEFRDRTILLSFWGTWCAPCRAEMPSLAHLAERIDRDDIALALVSNEELNVVRKYAEAESYDLPFYVTETIPSLFYPNTWPTAVVVGCDGALVARHVGGADWGSEAVYEFLTRQADATCS